MHDSNPPRSCALRMVQRISADLSNHFSFVCLFVCSLVHWDVCLFVWKNRFWHFETDFWLGNSFNSIRTPWIFDKERSIYIHGYIDLSIPWRSISTVDTDTPTWEYGWYQRSTRIHLRENTVDIDGRHGYTYGELRSTPDSMDRCYRSAVGFFGFFRNRVFSGRRCFLGEDHLLTGVDRCWRFHSWKKKVEWSLTPSTLTSLEFGEWKTSARAMERVQSVW